MPKVVLNINLSYDTFIPAAQKILVQWDCYRIILLQIIFKIQVDLLSFWTHSTPNTGTLTPSLFDLMSAITTLFKASWNECHVPTCQANLAVGFMQKKIFIHWEKQTLVDEPSNCSMSNVNFTLFFKFIRQSYRQFPIGIKLLISTIQYHITYWSETCHKWQLDKGPLL